MFSRRPLWLRLVLGVTGAAIAIGAWLFNLWANAMACAWVINGPCVPHYFDPEMMMFILPATGFGLILIAVAWAIGGQFAKN